MSKTLTRLALALVAASLCATAAAAQAAPAETTPTPAPEWVAVSPAEPGPPPPVADYDGPLKFDEVTRRARITYKPEPGFTEEARKFNVRGVVRLRAILSKAGEMANVTVVKHLPHGLTDKAIEAARQTRFEPAEKDGRTVSQYVVFEYNFNIY